MTYNVISSAKFPIKAWTNGVQVEDQAKQQLLNIAGMPFIHKHVAVMPDVHYGMGATVGSVIATKGAVIPAAVGVDIGCGMNAVRLSLKASDLPDSLKDLRSQIERDVPVGFNVHRTQEHHDWVWKRVPEVPKWLYENWSKLAGEKCFAQVGTLGGGNHFIELCLDENQDVWVMLHSGSRGLGNRIGTHFIAQAKRKMEEYFITLPDTDLAYIPDGSQDFKDYIESVEWAQQYAALNRTVMMELVLAALRRHLPAFETTQEAINCHHNYISREHHFGENVIVTRKGAVSAKVGQLGIIPGSMGAKSFIVCGKGHLESFCSCSHGAGRSMSRTQARKLFTVEDHALATAGVECRKDAEVVDETPAAYKDIDAVMAAQTDLVDVVHTLKQVLCVKG
jgi:tRNA-splicing ligase RtcB